MHDWDATTPCPSNPKVIRTASASMPRLAGTPIRTLCTWHFTHVHSHVKITVRVHMATTQPVN